MLSLEDHIAKALKGQLSDFKDYPDLGAEVRQVHRLVEHHISDLRALAERRNAGGITGTVKRATPRSAWRRSAMRCSTPQRPGWASAKSPSWRGSICATMRER